MRDLQGRELIGALKGYGFSNADIEYVYEKSEQYRNSVKEGEEKVLNQVQLAYESGAFPIDRKSQRRTPCVNLLAAALLQFVSRMRPKSAAGNLWR
jgi:hypothetical protein